MDAVPFMAIALKGWPQGLLSVSDGVNQPKPSRQTIQPGSWKPTI